ncbi:MAG: response regulator [Proteobacteria bacterium]|nr:response regulator [Pseudomonadota bacterium]
MANILIVDDDALLRETLRVVLESVGHDIRLATNGAEALRIVESYKPDLVLTDIIMPEMEGIELIRAVRKIYPSTPVIAISGGGRTGNVDFLRVAKTFGAAAIMQKPFEMDALLNTVQTSLAR